MANLLKKVLFVVLFITINFLDLNNSSSLGNFVVEPYLQNITSKSINILWESSSSEIYKLRITGIKSGYNRVYIDTTKVIIHNLKIKNLTPKTSYKYAFYNLSGKVIFNGKFTTPGNYKTTRLTKISVLGDSGVNSVEQYQIADLIYRSNPDIVLHAGDIVYPNGKAEDYANKYFLPFKKIISQYSVFPCVGNHDAMDIEGFNTYFYTPYLNSKSPSNRYYSFNNGLVHITIIDTNKDFTKDSLQYRWIEQDLLKYSLDKRFKKFTKIVMFHEPPFSSGTHGPNLDVARDLTPLFSKYNVKLVLSGHEHNYERIKREKDSNGKDIGPLYVISGGGGVATRTQNNINYDKSEIFKSQHHYLKLQISRKKIIGKAINKDGQVIDQWTIN